MISCLQGTDKLFIAVAVLLAIAFCIRQIARGLRFLIGKGRSWLSGSPVAAAQPPPPLRIPQSDRLPTAQSPPRSSPERDTSADMSGGDPEPTQPAATSLLRPGLAAFSLGRFLTQEEFVRLGGLETDWQLKNLFSSYDFVDWVQHNQVRVSGCRGRARRSDTEVESTESEEESEASSVDNSRGRRRRRG
eukprot:jgi/Mesvir1/23760/Mv18688-RA.1